MGRPRVHPLLAALTVTACALALLVQPGSSARGRDGGIFRVSVSPAAGFDSIDPALNVILGGWRRPVAVADSGGGG